MGVSRAYKRTGPRAGDDHGEVSLGLRILAFGDLLLMAASWIAVAVPGTG
jgi:hypothetical protein